MYKISLKRFIPFLLYKFYSTGMDADPELELLVRQVADLERPDGVEKSECQATDFARVVAASRNCYPYLRAAGAAFISAPQALPLLARRRRCLTCWPYPTYRNGCRS